MSARSALAGATTTAVVVAGVGNPAVVDATRDGDHQALVASIVGFADWDVAGEPGEMVVTVAIRLGVLVVLAAVLCGLVGRSRSRVAAWLGGWGAVAIAAALGGAAAYAYEVPVVLDGNNPAPTYVDGLVVAVDRGAAFGLWTGWLIGAVVALVTRPATAGVPAEPVAGAAGAAPSVEPPAPWWAPTYATDAGVRPGPTAFPASGLGKPVVAGVGEPVIMSTASGDPHPSDPGGTPAVAGPGPDATVAIPPDPAAEDPTTIGPDTADPTTVDTGAVDPTVVDPTAQVQRPPER